MIEISEDRALPGKIMHYEAVRIEYGNRKSCECENASYVIDFNNKIVRCNNCGAIVEPYVALCDIAKHYDREVRYLEYLLEEKRKLDEWKPRLKVVKDIAEHYHVGKKAPICPRCNQVFDLKELVSWTDAEY